MAQGSFTEFDKVRAGAYVRFKAVKRDLSMTGSSGVVVAVLPLAWGGDVTTLTAEDLLSGRSQEMVGYAVGDAGLTPIREVLKNAREIIVIRGDSGSTAATATVGTTLTAAARYGGVLGNNISVEVVSEGSGYSVVTYLNGSEVAKSSGVTAGEIADNDFVIFTGTGALEVKSLTNLTGGTNGSVVAWNTALEQKISSLRYDVVVNPDSSKFDSFESFIKAQHDAGKYVQGIAHTAYATGAGNGNFEGLIKLDSNQSIVLRSYGGVVETLDADKLIYYVAGLAAGTPINISNTYRVVPNGAEIIGDYGDRDTERRLEAGFFLFAYRRDGAVIIEKDINSLHTFSEDRDRAYSKNRTIRTLYYIEDYITTLFETGYIGKINGNEVGVAALTGDVVGFLSNLEDAGVIRNFDADNDLSVVVGRDSDTLIVDVWIQPIDSLEKLYLTIHTRA